MESVEMTQTVVAPQALAERLTQMEAVYPGTLGRLAKPAAREVLRERIEPIVDELLEQQSRPVDPSEDETDDDQPVTIRQRREAAMKGPFVEQIARCFRGRGILLKRGER